MARTVRRVRVVGNSPRRRRNARGAAPPGFKWAYTVPTRKGKHKRSKASRGRRHNLSPKQIKFFGTPAQKAALKRSRAAKRSNSARRTKATTVRRKRHTRRRNIGEILSLTLGNPPRRKKARRARKANKARKTKGATTMAATKRRRRRRAPNSGGTRRRRRTVKANAHRRRRTYRMNAGPRRRRRTYTRHNRRRVNRGHRRRNPGIGGIGAEIMDTLWMIGGAVGTGMLTQAVLGSGNASWAGYAGNMVAGFGLSFAVGKLLKMPQAAKAIFKGAVLQVVLRIIRDQTPFGQYTSNLGMGDYLASNWVTPQRYTDPLNSANIQIPSGWGAPPPVAVAAKGGVSGVTDFGSLYSPAGSGLYN